MTLTRFAFSLFLLFSDCPPDVPIQRAPKAKPLIGLAPSSDQYPKPDSVVPLLPISTYKMV